MKVNGIGIEKLRPDVAVVTMGVTTENKQLQVAQQENAVKMNNVIKALRNAGIESENIQTLSYSIDAVYDYVEGKSIFRGYRVANILKVTIKNVDKIGKAIDTAVLAGANYVGDVDFTVLNPNRYYRRALTYALNDAIKKAETMATFMGIMINKVPINIKEETIGYSPLAERARVKAFGATTPIEVGEIEITARVEVEFAYS
jgi:uncharacterized protein YggE